MNEKIELYTLSRVKSNGTINFVLSLKLAESQHFPQTPKNLIFSMQLVFFTVQRKIFTNKNIFLKSFIHVLFRIFFSKLNNKNVEVKDQRSPNMICTYTLFNQTLNGIISNLKHVQHTYYKIMPYCRASQPFFVVDPI